jgi:hypothetical protein
MDPVTLATTVVGLLAPYLLKVGEKVAGTLTDRAADAAQGVVQRLYQTLKARLRPGSHEAGQLEGVEAKPDSPARQQALAATLAEFLAEHPEVAAELEPLAVEAQQAGAQVQAIESGITAGGNVNLHAGGDITGRDRIGSDQPAKDRASPPPLASERRWLRSRPRPKARATTKLGLRVRFMLRRPALRSGGTPTWMPVAT